jgi:hypothetical protein
MDIQTTSIVIAAIGVLIAAVNQIYSSQQANQQRQVEIETRQAELYMQVSQRFSSTEMRRAYQSALYMQEWESLDDWNRKYGLQSDAWVANTQLGIFFGALGVFVEQGLLDAALIDDLMGEYIVNVWERLLPMVNEFRKVNPRQGDKFEYLYDLMKQRGAVGLGWEHLQ